VVGSAAGAEAGGLSHVDEAGGVRMVDVGAKPPVHRRAVAEATVEMRAETVLMLRELPKGDALVTAQLAGIMAAKRTAELIPLCHPLPLSAVGVELDVIENGVRIRASAETTAQTGVEMEALTAAAVAALTVYDMAKAVDKEMVVTGVRLVEKSKGSAPGKRSAQRSAKPNTEVRAAEGGAGTRR
jgi:cyclic pyranopterin phosphate synthase